MKRIYEFRYDDGDNFIDLGNIKSIYTSDYGTCVTIYFLKGFEYVANPKSGEYDLIEPYIQFSFSKDQEKLDFARSITKEWEKYLESVEIDKKGKS